MPAASPNLSSNPYVFFLSLLLLQKRHRLPLSPRAEGGRALHALLSKLTHMHRTSLRRASSARSASRTSSRPPSDRRSRSTLPTSTARSTRTASLLLPRGFCQGSMKGQHAVRAKGVDSIFSASTICLMNTPCARIHLSRHIDFAS
jgi:hypothetical protein